MSAPDEFVDAFFRKTGKTARDLEKLAEEILALPHDVSNLRSMQPGQRILDMVNDLEGRVIGPERTDRNQVSGRRLLIDTERKELLHKACEWSLTGKFTKEELVAWLKKYFAIQRYAEEAQLASEFLVRDRTDDSVN